MNRLVAIVLSAASPAALAAEPDAATRAVRHDVQHHHGGGAAWFLEAERLEYRAGEGDAALHWDAQGWWGRDLLKLWAKSEGEYAFDADELEEGEVQALLSRAIGRYFDFQGGVRRDFGAGADRTHAVVGVQGLAPYWFEIDAAAFISAHGEVSARIEAEYDLLLTQRLILQPRAELEFSAEDAPSRGLGAGLANVELGARLRYEIRREVAPYVGVSWSRDVGATADFARAGGEDPSRLSFVAGLKFWF